MLQFENICFDEINQMIYFVVTHVLITTIKIFLSISFRAHSLMKLAFVVTIGIKTLHLLPQHIILSTRSKLIVR